MMRGGSADADWQDYPVDRSQLSCSCIHDILHESGERRLGGTGTMATLR
jgi:hypothetical protein